MRLVQSGLNEIEIKSDDGELIGVCNLNGNVYDCIVKGNRFIAVNQKDIKEKTRDVLGIII